MLCGNGDSMLPRRTSSLRLRRLVYSPSVLVSMGLYFWSAVGIEEEPGRKHVGEQTVLLICFRILGGCDKCYRLSRYDCLRVLLYLHLFLLPPILYCLVQSSLRSQRYTCYVETSYRPLFPSCWHASFRRECVVGPSRVLGLTS